MKLDSLENLMIHELQDLHSAEKQMIAALPKMAKAASSPRLKQYLDEHLKQTQRQLERLEVVMEMFQQSPGRHKCKGMEGLIKEGEEIIKEKAEPQVKDAALIAAAQRIEHYEMAGYGTVRTFAQILGQDEAVRQLQETLDEEKETDTKLTDVAVSEINPAAV